MLTVTEKLLVITQMVSTVLPRIWYALSYNKNLESRYLHCPRLLPETLSRTKMIALPSTRVQTSFLQEILVLVGMVFRLDLFLRMLLSLVSPSLITRLSTSKQRVVKQYPCSGIYLSDSPLSDQALRIKTKASATDASVTNVTYSVRCSIQPIFSMTPQI